ncbi:ABC transporter permease subunit [Anaerobacillus alkaliphilus]|uniref:ABC transporter permease subunit n=1 Tax=Anaerobacillus alkaliphilus TaxID=1548597 RepID=A0A4Q0VQN5_9BACI|nr:ABC transporter permease [Anaerobacillus alkaliphilus]RXI96695.1 ABC transporter permease subunit [Anaerobacillus alkaliphilus]
MNLFFEGIAKAIEMILSGDREILQITYTTLRVCLTAIFISTVVGIPLGVLLGLHSFPGKKIVLVFVNIGMGLPPVVAGLYITMLLWRSGPLGHLGLLYTTHAIVMAQILVSLPIIIGLTSAAFQQIDQKMLMQIRALGATGFQRIGLLLRETRLAIFAAIMAGLGRVLAEVGAAMMVGGNIKGDTRILTTSMVMEVSKGNFDVAIALSFILMTLAFMITFLLTSLQQRKQRL